MNREDYERHRRRVLFRSCMTLALIVALVVAMFVDPPWLIVWFLDAAIAVNFILSFRGYRESKRRADIAGVKLMDTLCELALSTHVAAGDYQEYCVECPPGTAWPCPIYLHAMTVSTETPKNKLRFLRKNGPPVLR